MKCILVIEMHPDSGETVTKAVLLEMPKESYKELTASNDSFELDELAIECRDADDPEADYPVLAISLTPTKSKKPAEFRVTFRKVQVWCNERVVEPLKAVHRSRRSKRQ